jgi:hypothetical protein
MPAWPEKSQAIPKRDKEEGRAGQGRGGGRNKINSLSLGY